MKKLTAPEVMAIWRKFLDENDCTANTWTGARFVWANVIWRWPAYLKAHS